MKQLPLRTINVLTVTHRTLTALYVATIAITFNGQSYYSNSSISFMSAKVKLR